MLQLTRGTNFELGNKKDNITVIYTPWSNLKKDGSMAVGQVSFKNPKIVCPTSEIFSSINCSNPFSRSRES